MLTHRQRSFIATLESVEGTLNFLDQLHGRPIVLGAPERTPEHSPKFEDIALAGFGRRFRIARRLGKLTRPAPETAIPVGRNESHYLGHVPEHVDAAPLQLYFRSMENGYRLFVRSPVRYGKSFYIHAENCVCALDSPHEGSYASLFDLLDENDAPIAYEALEDDMTLRLGPAGKGTALMLRTFAGLPYTYICTQGQRPLELRLKIQQRNAAYVSAPDEV